MTAIKRTNEEWLELVQTQRASGLTMKTWCAANGVNLYTMADRASKLRRDGLLTEPKPNRGVKSRRRSEWVEVSLPATVIPRSSTEIEVRINGFTVTVTENFSEAVFAQICKTLMALC